MNAEVIDFALARAQLARTPTTRTTIVVRVATMKADEEIYRYLGFSDDMPLEEVQRVIATAFSLPGHTPSPAHFTSADTTVGTVGTVGTVLHPGHGPFSFIWGLWRFDLWRVEALPRDDATPDAVCVAGCGSIDGGAFDISEVNRRLVGEDWANGILHQVRDEVRDVITRSKQHDFILLLHALDVGKGGVDKHARDVARTLPRERTDMARDAYWCTVLALACLGDAQTTDSVTQSTFAALGWGDHSAAEIRALCAGSLVRLTALGALGPRRVPPVARLEIFRELVRR
ncbi:hypothetical protein [Corynebacterium mayonis]|uniref:hypothetical protein n=1 Tax=Corynebacterium mayonis TaxID=3062461 RepID=UPI0031401D2F